ncbi:MAG: hypothetical protein FWD34_02030 [Oscillospiraceae bacterium]|nr:hypothetical protein [Oscillospiraceae bacterium]
MIHELLPPSSCALCKGCCFFDENDKWEIPASVNTDENMRCCYLNKNGCALGENKPPECALYPFRVMRFGELMVIALCTYCPEILKLPLSVLHEFVENNYKKMLELKTEIKEYKNNYIILKVL